ncbi:histidine--tRNA ligase [Alkalicoccobacillus murimartini]|uniref:Histidine--tRNA ligase n=1 Tax=Alkalicoccobacillus murimartini TaxID=171685 RepID=A0ABT9YIS7_9BACI|nr:histidine--tRNA ligase [Alkalicoccobacillus murimartini]MDQ0206939.1 histidyl-tRNA synthetase [Alkalicoccobacillus murimartini]
MKKMSYQNVKGTQDFMPEEQNTRRKIQQVLEQTFTEYGCKPLETPILNYTSLMASKYAGGAEILNEMYRLTDRGERDLALRYDLTIPFAKVIALNPTVGFPFKRYEIGKVFRDGPIKKGRLREFTQCDVDIVGVKSQMAEAELMMMAIDAFKKLNLDVVIQYNNRKLLIGMLEVFKVPEDLMNKVILTIDKVEKVGVEAIRSELLDLAVPSSSLEQVMTFLQSDSREFFEQYAKQNEHIRQGLSEIEELQTYLEYLDMTDQCQFNPLLARGLEIYTGTIYEMFLKDGSIQSSIGSGGRYENAIGGLVGSGENIATVGISFGLDVIAVAMQGRDEMLSEIDYYIIPLQTQKESLKLARYLRQQGYRVECELGGKKLSKAMERANKQKVRYVVVVGQDEVERNEYRVKDMVTGEEGGVGFGFN